MNKVPWEFFSPRTQPNKYPSLTMIAYSSHHKSTNLFKWSEETHHIPPSWNQWVFENSIQRLQDKRLTMCLSPGSNTIWSKNSSNLWTSYKVRGKKNLPGSNWQLKIPWILYSSFSPHKAIMPNFLSRRPNIKTIPLFSGICFQKLFLKTHVMPWQLLFQWVFIESLMGQREEVQRSQHQKMSLQFP